MRFWPFTERRSAVADQVVSYLLRRASGEMASDWRTTGVAQGAAAVWGAAFAAAVPSARADVLTPSVLHHLGRALLLHGEAVWTITIGPGGIELTPATVEGVVGGAAPSSWRYRLVQASPSLEGAVEHKLTLPAASVLHPRINCDRDAWRGCSPIDAAGSTATLAARLERSLSDEAGTPGGFVLPAPVDGQDTTVDDLRDDLAALKGALAVVETMAGGWAEGPGRAPMGDWRPQRLGPAPPAPVVQLRQDAALGILHAAGIAPSIVMGGPANDQREGLRRFLYQHLQPVARVVAAELGLKLDSPGLTFDFSALRAGDVAAGARAYNSLVSAGMDGAQAAKVAGLELTT